MPTQHSSGELCLLGKRRRETLICNAGVRDLADMIESSWAAAVKILLHIEYVETAKIFFPDGLGAAQEIFGLVSNENADDRSDKMRNLSSTVFESVLSYLGVADPDSSSSKISVDMEDSDGVPVVMWDSSLPSSIASAKRAKAEEIASKDFRKE